MMTIAIAKKGLIRLTNVPTNDNRTISVNFKGLEIMGIHAHTGDKNKDYLKSLNNSSADIILGDFNAGDYEASENRLIFNSILKGHKNICNQDTYTTANGHLTPIDHVFVHNDVVLKCSNLVVHNEIKHSDHFPLTLEIDV